MLKLSESIKQSANKDIISVKSALAIVSPIDTEREETIDLLKRLEKEVGMTLGSEINEHIAKMQGQKFNSAAYHYEKQIGDQ